MSKTKYNVEFVMTAEAGEVVKESQKATNAVGKLVDAQREAANAASKYAKGQAQVGAVSRQTRAAIGNVGLQLQDVAVQYQAGTAASVIFAQQVPQMLSGFGPMAAIVGTVAAFAAVIGGALYNAMEDTRTASDKLKESTEKLDEVYKQLQPGIDELSEGFVRLTKADALAAKSVLAATLIDLRDAVDALNMSMREQLDENVFTTWFHDTEDAMIEFNRALSQGIDLDKITEINEKGLDFIFARNEDLGGSNTRVKFEDLNEALDQLVDKFNLTSDEAVDLLSILNAKETAGSAEQFEDIRRQTAQLATATNSTSIEFKRFIRDLINATTQQINYHESLDNLTKLKEKDIKLTVQQSNLLKKQGVNIEDPKEVERALARTQKINEAYVEGLRKIQNEEAAAYEDRFEAIVGNEKRTAEALEYIREEERKKQKENGENTEKINKAYTDGLRKARNAQAEEYRDFFAIQGELAKRTHDAIEYVRDQELKKQEELARETEKHSKRMAKLLAEIKPETQLLDADSDVSKNIRALNDLFTQGKVNADEFTKALSGIYESAGIKTLNSQFKENVGLIGDSLTNIQALASEGGDSYRRLGAAVQALQSIQAIAAILNQGAGGDPLTAFARMAAMASAVASLGVSVGGVFDGGGSAINKSHEAAREVGRGTGTVLGDPTAASESIAKAVEITAEATSELVGINTRMLDALTNLQAGISGATTLIARQGLPEFDIPSVFGGLEDFGAIGQLSKVFLDISSIIPGLGSILNEIIGGKSSLQGQGVQISGDTFDNILDDVLVEGFSRYKVKDNLFSSTKIKVFTEELDKAAQTQFRLVFESIGDTVSAGAETLGFSIDEIEKAFANIELDTAAIDLKDLNPEEQQQAISDYFSSVFDQVVGGVVPFVEEFQRAGEGAGETLARLATSVDVVDEVLFRLNTTAEAFGDLEGSLFGGTGDVLADLKIRETFIDAAGGVEVLSGNVSSFVDRFFDENQRLNLASEDFERSLRRIGLPQEQIDSILKGEDAFKELVTNLDFSSEAAAKQSGQLLGLVGIAETYYDSVEEVNDKLNESNNELQQIADNITDVVSSLNDFVNAEFRPPAEQDAIVAKTFKDQLAGFDIAEEITKGTRGKFLDVAESLGLLNEINFQAGGVFEGLENAVTNLFESADAFFDMTESRADEAKAESERVQGIRDEIADIYEGILGQAPDAEAVEYWYQQVEKAGVTLEDVGDKISGSAEAVTKGLVDQFESVFGFEPDTSSIDTWRDVLSALGSDMVAVSDQMSDMQETLSDELGDVFSNILGRSPNTDELERWLSAVMLSGITFSNVADSISTSAEALALDAEERAGLDIRLMGLLGQGAEALAAQRELELQKIRPANRELQQRIWALEDEAEAAGALAKIRSVDSDLEIRLLRAQGNEQAALLKERERELEGLTDYQQGLLRQIWAIEDQKSAIDLLTEAQEAANDEYERQADVLVRARDELIGLGKSLRDFIFDLNTGSLSALNPRDQFIEAQRNFNIVAAQAQLGDVNALGELESASSAYLDKAQSFFGGATTQYSDAFREVNNALLRSAEVAERQAANKDSEIDLLKKQTENSDITNAKLKLLEDRLLQLQKSNSTLTSQLITLTESGNDILQDIKDDNALEAS